MGKIKFLWCINIHSSLFSMVFYSNGLYNVRRKVYIFICLYCLYSFSAALSDVVGICAGHIYYYFMDVLPKVAKIRKWKRTEFIPTPKFVKKLFGQVIPEDEEVEINQNNDGEHLHID